MPRPTTRAKSDVSLALTQLRESLGDSLQTFANRLHVALTTCGRWETSNPPRGKTLRRFYLLARRHEHPSAEVFAAALEREKQHLGMRNRIAQIQDAFNLHDARIVLEEIWNNRDPFEDEQCERYLKLADLLLIDGRKILKGENQ